jgi:predicted Rossmann fold nucleotide-binding protein DprA/Smf involved in DNA uptake
MAKMTPAQWRQYADQWKQAGPELDRVRREELKNWKYDWRIVDALLEIGAKSPHKEDEPNGLVEMQRLFMKAARKQGRLPYTMRETPGGYSVCRESGAGVPPARSNIAAGTAAPHLYIVGDPAILDRPKMALFCSVKCPGKLILETYDLAQRFRNEGVLVISPFHSPMEQECLRIQLRSPHPVVWALARGVYRQIPAKPVDCRAAVAEGRLVMTTTFPDTVRHITAITATTRNRLVVDMATAVVVAHAAPGSKMEALCREILAAGKSLYTFDHPANAGILAIGAKRIEDMNLAAWSNATDSS